MWNKEDYSLIVETLMAGKTVIKQLLERADLILENRILEDPKDDNVEYKRSLLAKLKVKNEELLESLDHLPSPSNDPTEEHLAVLHSLCMGGSLEIAYNLPIGSRGTIGPLAKTLLRR